MGGKLPARREGHLAYLSFTDMYQYHRNIRMPPELVN